MGQEDEAATTPVSQVTLKKMEAATSFNVSPG